AGSRDTVQWRRSRQIRGMRFIMVLNADKREGATFDWAAQRAAPALFEEKEQCLRRAGLLGL
ncbi:MAG: hypothetical protein D3922_09680, partial [Candidatus Electrothrix sp. AR1]|nr:hypothetical protein [Candidatus Electrothrix sp. AR1]